MRRLQDQRILHLIETGGPGGAERVLLELAKHFARDGRSVVGLLRPGWLYDHVVSCGLPFVPLGSSRGGEFGIISRLSRVIQEQRITLIHAHEFYMSVIAAFASYVSGVPLIMTVHGRNYYPERMRRRLLYRLATKLAACTVAVSRDLAEFFSAVTGAPRQRIHVIYNGVVPCSSRGSAADSQPLARLEIAPSAKIVGTIGNLYPVKGQKHLLRALRIILQRQPNVHLLLFGRGEGLTELLAEAAEARIQDKVHFLGFRDDVPQWLRVFDVFVLPSLSEGLPLSLLEAMSARIPVVVTSVGGMPEVVADGKTGFIVRPGDPEALADRILFLLEHPGTAAAMGAEGGRVYEEKFTLTKMVERYAELYERVSGGSCFYRSAPEKTSDTTGLSPVALKTGSHASLQDLGR